MRDPFAWSLPLGRLFGITVRVSIWFFVFIVAMWLKKVMGHNGQPSQPGEASAMLVLMLLLFLSVLLHEFGHCFAARYVDGEANEVLLWPLGGLARCEIPHSAWAHFVTAAGGPLVNLLLCAVSGAVLVGSHFQPSFNPLPQQAWNTHLYNFVEGRNYGSEWAGRMYETLPYWIHLVAQFFWVNWFMLLLNVLLCGFPLDGGRMLQAILWPRLGYRSAMRTAIFIGFIVMFVTAAYGFFENETLVLGLAICIYLCCKQEWITLEMGGDESLFGYDFSQGYTSLERDQPPPQRKKRPNFFQRWLQRRAAKKLQRQQVQQEADERRMDELLDKIAREGMQALTEEENRFLKRVAEDRNRHRQ